MEEIKKGIYRHFKGNLYEVIGLAKHSETLEPLVVYKALYGDYGLWVRPLSSWMEPVIRNNETIERFKFLGDNINIDNK